ncbi:MAG: hypothetical protein J3K34DRAFT_520707 [Monoraphidium minutum]|nr:MAG: hypothetical protein J3K34DRAFT_520707 [Monoraphidium minutum]
MPPKQQNEEATRGGQGTVLAGPDVSAFQAAGIPSVFRPRRRSSPPAIGGAGTSGQGGASSGGCEPVDGAQLVKRYEQLRREHAAKEAASAPAIIAANQAQLASWVDRMKAGLAARSSGGPPLPKTTSAASARSGGGARAGSGAGCGSGAAAPSASLPSSEDAGADPGAGSDSSYEGPRRGRAKKKARPDPSPPPPPRPPPPEPEADGGGDRPLATRGGAGVSTRDVKIGRYRTHVLPPSQRLPSYCSWEFLLRNELARDEGRRMYYVDDTGETVPASDDEDDDRFSLPWDGTEGPGHDYALRALLAEEGAGHGVIAALAEHLSVREERLLERADALRPRERRRDGDVWSEDFGAQAGVLEAAFCRRCGLYNCRQHGAGGVKPTLKPPPPPAAGAAGPPCSDGCWRAAAAGGGAAEGAAAEGAAAEGAAGGGAAAAAAGADAAGGGGAAAEGGGGGAAEWSVYDEGLLDAAVRLFGEDPCQVALALDPDRFSCADVSARLAARRGGGGGGGGSGDGEEAGGRAGGKRGAARRKKKIIEQQNRAARKAVVLQRFHRSEEDGWPAYTPCECEGPCKAGSCSCIASANFCEKFCGCAGCADAKFEGCKCTTRCRTTRCSCLLANRECDPDRCRGCAPTADGAAAPGTECCNMNLRLRRRKHVVMSLSSTHGWGAFLAEDAGRGEFVGEYVGDLLGQEEADRRGRIYDKIDNSYLFNVNQQWVIDARRRGNKLRFANHSTKPNCTARVDGDHRVAIFAAEDIKAGEELYDLDNAPDWALTN